MLKKNASVGLAIALTLATVPEPLAALLKSHAVLAQSASVTFPLPTAVPNGTTVKISSSPVMAGISQALKQGFEGQFPGTGIALENGDMAAALQAVLGGKVDLAAISRPLTPEEKAQGLVEVAVRREKLAIVVGSGNPFNGDLTNDQFTQIFRGQVTDWSQVGGQPGPIRVIDLPEASDTRQAFRGYPSFAESISTGGNAVKLTEDSGAAVIQALGNDGIGYAIASQVLNRPEVRVLPMYGSLPTDPKFPFSQPFSYVYKGPNPNPAVQAFLGYATAPTGQEIIASARAKGSTVASAANGTANGAANTTASGANAGANANGVATGAAATGAAANNGAAPAQPGTSPNASASPSASAAASGAPTGSPGTASPNPALSPGNASTALIPGDAGIADSTASPLGIPSWIWWLLPLGLLGILLGWLLQGKDPELDFPEPAAPDGDDDAAAGLPRLVEGADAAGGIAFSDYLGNIPDTLGGIETDGTALANLTEGAAELSRNDDLELSGLFDDGSAAGAGAALAVGGAALAGAAATGGTPSLERESRIVLVPRNPQQAHVYWDVPRELRQAMQAEGGQSLAIRLYDVTDIDINHQEPNSVQQFECDELARDRAIPIPASDRDYVAELGYTTADERWLKLSRSASVHVAASNPFSLPSNPLAAPAQPTGGLENLADVMGGMGGAIAGAAAGAAGAASTAGDNALSFLFGDKSQPELDCRLVLVPRNAQQAYAYWDLSPSLQESLQRHGQALILHLYDVTDGQHDSLSPVAQLDCEPNVHELNVPIPTGDRDYSVELGYVMGDGSWMGLARSSPVHIAA